MVESYGLLNDIFPFPSIPDAGYPIFDLNLANVLFDLILPSVLPLARLEIQNRSLRWEGKISSITRELKHDWKYIKFISST